MADSSNDDGYSLRKRLAMGKPLPGGDFGVAKFDSGKDGTGKGINQTSEVLSDDKRTPLHGHNQGNPDHGEFK